MIYSETELETTEAPAGDQGALQYLRDTWSAFEAISPAIIDLQHRAALARQHYTQTGNQAQADAALLAIHELTKLQNVHHRVVTWAEQAAGAVGLGVVQIPLGVAGVSIAALLVAWVFRKYAAQHEALELLEAGVLTPEQFQALDIIDPPGIGADIAGIAGGVGKWVLLVILGLAFLEGVKRGKFFGNPPLIMFGNPPGPMSENVVLIGYEHLEDGELYLHEFEGDVGMEAQPDGSLSIGHEDKAIWKDFS